MKIDGISITVCCYNDGHLLPNFLDTFLVLKKIELKVELNIIDNASTDNTKQVFNNYLASFENTEFEFNYHYEGTRGLNHARNKGITVAKYQYIGFSDADAKFHPFYLKVLINLILKESPLIIFGPYYPWYNSEKPKWYKDEYNSYDLKQTSGYVKENIYPNGINMIYEIETLKKIGSFGTEIVYKGLNDRGEETELFYRYKNTIKKNHIYYEPDLIVYHYTRPKTMTLNHWIKSNWGTGKNHAKFMGNTSLSKNVKDILWILKIVFIDSLKHIFRFENYKYEFVQNFLIEKIFSHVYTFSLAYHRIKKKSTN